VTDPPDPSEIGPLERLVLETTAKGGTRTIRRGWPLGLMLVLLAGAAAGQLLGWFVVDWQIVLSLSIGAVIGAGELVSRYRDAPLRAVRTKPAGFYIFVNAAAAVLALVMLRFFGITFGIAEGADSASKVGWMQALAAGFSAMAIFRTSIFVVRAGDDDIGVGPVAFLQIILSACDRAVDRLRAESRAMFVAELMKNVSFARAHAALPTLCLALMQNLPDEDQKRLGQDVKNLKDSGIDDRMKGSILGLVILNVVGEEVLAAAVSTLGSKLHPIHHIALTPPKLTLAVGESAVIQAQTYNAANAEIGDCECAWLSSNPAVADIDRGYVRALTPGRAHITASCDQIREVIKVEVT
jgi:hypothetical protein